MEPTADNRQKDQEQAAKHVSDAHGILQDLRQELSEHPQLEDAILRLEMALSLLTTKSGGML